MLRQLEVGLLALFRLQSDTQLHQKVIEGIYEVVNKVELVVVHVPGQDNGDGPSTLQGHLLRMREVNELVSLAMHEETRTRDILNQVYIPEVVLDCILGPRACLIPHYVTDRHERRHQQQRTRLSLRRN